VELSAIELKYKSLDELKIIRNEIFARKGYIFNSEDLLKHFSTFDWYKPKYENVDYLLTGLDKKNIQTVLELEKRKMAELDRRIIRINEADRYNPKEETSKLRSSARTVRRGGESFTACSVYLGVLPRRGISYW